MGSDYNSQRGKRPDNAHDTPNRLSTIWQSDYENSLTCLAVWGRVAGWGQVSPDLTPKLKGHHHANTS